MITASDSVLGANAERSRNHNRQMVLGHIRAAGRMGRADIARASGLSIQAVSNITSDLLDDGMILKKGRRAEGRGHPPVMFAVNPEGGYALGVEIRPNALFATILNLCGDVIASDRRSLAADDRRTITREVLAVREALVAAAGVPEDRLLGAGIVMPGPFGETGIGESGASLPDWVDVSPADWFSQKLDMPVLVENDANAAAMAEQISGAAEGLQSYCYLYFGRGLGLGTMINGKLLVGTGGNAGEIGQIPVPSAGRSVSLESVVSRLSVEEALRERGIEVQGSEDLARLYEAEEPALLAWLDAAREPLSAAVAMIENIFDPETVILGGAMPEAILEHLVREAALTTRSVAFRKDRAVPRLMKGASGSMTATLGAAALVINQAFTPKLSVAA